MKRILLVSTILSLPIFAAGNVAGLWHMDAGSGQIVADSSSYGNNGYLGSTTAADANDPAWAAGKFGGALQFNGSNNFVQVPNSASLNIAGSITLEAWVKLDANNVYQGVIARWNDTISTRRGYALTIDKFGRLRFDVSHTGHFGAFSGPCTVNTAYQLSCPDDVVVFSHTLIPTGRWTHVAGVFDSSAKTAQVFVNGVADTSVATMASNIFDNGEPVLIGAADFTGNRVFLHGSIDEARVWKRALSAGELLSSAQAGLRALWHFNNDITDSSGYGNDGAVVGPTFTPNSKFGAASLSFDGINDYAYSGTNITLEITGPITVEAWVKMNARPVGTNTFAPIVAKWNDEPGNNYRSYALAITPDGSARFDVSHTGAYSCGSFNNFGPYKCASADSALVISSAKVPLGTWTHIAGVFDGTKLQVFVNGVPDTSIATKASNIFVSGFPVAFGFAYEGTVGPQFANGSIDEVQIWARGLSAQEIAFEGTGPTSAELSLPAVIGQDHLQDIGGGNGSGAIYEPEFTAGTMTPAMFLEFVIPDAAGAQITSIKSHVSNGNGASLVGAVTGNGGRDALITGKTGNPPILNLDMSLSDKTKVGVQFDWK